MFYFTFRFLTREVFSSVGYISRSTSGRKELAGLYARVLFRRTYSPKDSAGSVFYGVGNPIEELILTKPDVLEKWAEKNPSALKKIVRDNRGVFLTTCKSCGEIAEVSTS